MIEVEGLDDLVAELESFTDGFEADVTTSLQEISRSLPNELRRAIDASGKEERSGRLLDSIRTTVRNDQLDLEMVYYGYYQVFGVTGKKVAGFGLPESVYGAFSAGFQSPQGLNNFQFTKTKHPGIFGVRTAANLIENLDDLIVATILEE